MAKNHRFGKSDRTMVRSDGTVRLNFDIDSVESFLEVAQMGRDSIDAGLPQGFMTDPDQMVEEDPQWSPMKFEEFKEALRKGDFSESLEAFDEAMLEINEGIESAKVVYDVTGDAVDIGRYLSGVPENMVSIVKDGTDMPVVSVIVSIGGSHRITAEELTQKAAAIAGVLEWIRGSGIGVELFAGKANVSSDLEWHRFVRVAASWESWDVQTVSMMCGHVSTFRSGFFTADNSLSENAKEYIMSRGSSTAADRFSIPEYASARPCVVIGPHRGGHFDPLKLIEAIREVVDEGRLEDGSFPVVEL